MKRKSTIVAGWALRVWLALCVVNATAALPTPAEADSVANAQPIAWNELGAKATAQYSGEGLAVSVTPNGAKLRCAFQKLEADVTPEGLRLRSTTAGASNTVFGLTAISLRREHGQCSALPPTGSVETANAIARFIRPGLIEEYSVSVDGLRQDFIIPERVAGQGTLRIELKVSGASAEAASDGARLVLEGSGRTLNYHRLRATDAAGRELAAWMEVAAKSEIRNPKSDAGLAVMVEVGGATYPVRIDPTFSDANWMGVDLAGVNGDVYAAVVDASGNLYVGGQFTLAGGASATNIAKWNGSSWSALGSSLSGDVYALAVSGNDLYVGGDFTTAGGVAATNIAKWNGSSWSALGSGLVGGSYYHGVLGLAVSGGNLFAGGYFTNAGGVAANHVAKWNGSSWSALGSGTDQLVQALAVSGGNLYAGGGFTIAGGTAANHIAKWNGSKWSALGAGMNGQVLALAVSGSDLYAGGWSTIAKWDGHKWSALGSWGGGAVFALAVSGSDLIVGGAFTTGSAINIARWNGSSWSALGSGMDRRVWAVAVSGSDLYAGGHLTTAGGVVADHVAKWNGNSWSALGAGTNYFWMDDVVRAFAVSGSNLYAGVSGYVAKWDGSRWTVLPDWTADPWSGFSYIYALAAVGDDLYAAGDDFSLVDDGYYEIGCVTKWNGSSWTALGNWNDAGVHVLAASGTNLYAAGAFANAGDVPVDFVVKWNDGEWLSLGSVIDGTVHALAASGSDLYAGGEFMTADGAAAHHVARWNGSSWSALGSGMDGAVFVLGVSGNDLYAGGTFTTAGGVAATNIAKWSGHSWSALGPGIAAPSDAPDYGGRVNALAVSGSDLYVGGHFTTAGGVAANSIAKWDGTGWSALGSGMNGVFPAVYALAVASSGAELYAGGDFTTAGGKTSPNAARATLLSIPPLPSLTILRTATNTVVISWPSPSTGFVLQQNSNGLGSVNWSNVTAGVQTVGTNETLIVNPIGGSRFYRLVKP